MEKWKRFGNLTRAVKVALRLRGSFLLGLLWIMPVVLPAQVNRPDTLETLARSFYNTDVDSSRYFARKLQEKARKAGNHEQVAWAYNWVAICYIRNGLSDSVRYYLDLCIDYCEQHNIETVKAKALLNLSINYYQTGDYLQAGETGMEALRYFEVVSDTLGVAHALYNTGLSYQRMERIPEAQSFYRRALPIYKEKGGVLDRANTYNAIGSVCMALGDQDSALYYYQQAVDEKLAVGAWAYCGSEYSNIASIMEETGRGDEAIRYYTMSFRAFGAEQNIRGMALVAGNLSKFKLAGQDWDSAIYFGRISAAYADSTGDLFLLSKSHSRLSEAYRAYGDFENAFFHARSHDSIAELIKSADVQKNMDELFIKYETAKREKELADAQLANQRKQFWLLGSIVGMLVLLLALLLLYRSSQERKKRLIAMARADLESERNRISMDLHDHLGAELAIITSHLDLQAYRSPDEEAKSKLSELAEQAREANAQLRETIWSVRHTKVSLDQLCGKVREFANRRFAGTKMGFVLDCRGQVDLTPGQALNLFRVIQEGLNNAQKYSEASTVRLEIKPEDGSLRLSLSDDGVGFRENQIRPGYGLSNMRERVGQMGGTIDISGSSGTQIRLSIPLKAKIGSQG